MALLTRRQLLESPAAVLAGGEPIEVRSTAGTVRAGAPDYTWEWSAADDTFRLRDSKGRVAASGKLQPAIVTVRARARVCTPGRVAGHEAGSDSLTVRYGGVNGGGGIGITLRFQASGIWFEPVVYESTSPEDVVDLRYFAEGTGDDARPALACRYVVMPGINEGTAVSPILTADTRLNVTNWLGRGSLPAPGLHQQWGLPAHFFCGFERGGYGQPGALTTGLSGAFCCGLAGLPAGDLFLQTAAGRHSLIVSVRSDLWHHARGPARLSLGAKLLWTMGSDFREAIRAYYLGLEREGAIRPKRSSPRKSAAMLSPQFNTWGAQVATGKAGARLDEASLNQLYEDVRRAGMKPGMFVIDDKWEGKYGNLEHSAGRLPHFEEFLERVRRDGLRTGLWAAFMRCEDPRDLGLAPAHMLRGADGKPIRNSGGWYLLDFTQPEVQTVLRERARRFARRYRPDLIKFDFGYELPPLATAAPKDMSWAGERMLLKGLEVVVGALREENPDIVVMYYSLSPLLLDTSTCTAPTTSTCAPESTTLRPTGVSGSRACWASWEYPPTGRAGTTGSRCRKSGSIRRLPARWGHSRASGETSGIAGHPRSEWPNTTGCPVCCAARRGSASSRSERRRPLPRLAARTPPRGRGTRAKSSSAWPCGERAPTAT